MISCCKNCDHRVYDCHINCEDYKKYREVIDSTKTEKKNNYALADYVYAARINMKHRRHKYKRKQEYTNGYMR